MVKKLKKHLTIFNIGIVLKIVRLITLLCLLLITSCDEPKEYDDVEVYIVSFTKWGDRKVSIEYQVENTGSKSIDGWKVWFEVNFTRGNKLVCYHGITYHLNPGDLSSPRVAERIIPVYIDDATYAKLKRIMVY